MRVCLKSFIYHILKSVLPNIIQCVLPNTILKVSFRTWCHVSFQTWGYVSFRTWIGSYLELKHKCSSQLRTSSETYPNPKGEHNGAIGPKYASKIKSTELESLALWFYYHWLKKQQNVIKLYILRKSWKIKVQPAKVHLFWESQKK